jgi:hypothetical protein
VAVVVDAPAGRRVCNSSFREAMSLIAWFNLVVAALS